MPSGEIMRATTETMIEQGAWSKQWDQRMTFGEMNASESEDMDVATS